MSLVSKTFVIDDLSGTIYDFERIGDLLPMHEHTQINNHISIVSRGSFMARGKSWTRELRLGAVVQWEPHDPHEFEALEPLSRLVNVKTNFQRNCSTP